MEEERRVVLVTGGSRGIGKETAKVYAENGYDVAINYVSDKTDVEGILLCSDGLTNMLEFEQIERVLNEKLDAQDMVRKLIHKSNNRGGNDNISVAYLKRGVQ